MINSETRRHPKIPTTWLPTYLLSSLKDYETSSSNPNILILTDEFLDEEVEGCQVEGMPVGAKVEPSFGEIYHPR